MGDHGIRILSLAGLSGGQEWRLRMVHDRPQHTLLWITRGQGRLLLNGRLRGVGVHNAILLPARSLFSLDLGRQGFGQAVLIPPSSSLRLPTDPWQLRVRDGDAQGELTALIETAQREQAMKRPLFEDAMEAHVALMSVWLRRQIALEQSARSTPTDAEALSARYCQALARDFASGASVPDYAARLNVSATQLTQAVQTATGRSPADLLAERLVHAARVMLETSAQSARNIATHLGFESDAYFARFIQQHTGKSPDHLRPGAGAAAAAPHARVRSA
ncbi:AraC family transcriptional regulator [Sulfitobacter sp. HNIBRBA3233]|uniref:AraC family transcriptional regulator n=1 Tax=Sulfitobacter marinivivus TaxID=3158558 RepID=UPI0032DFDB64